MKKSCLFKALLFLFIFFVLLAKPVWAGSYLELEPSSGTITTSGTDINVNIDTDGSAAKSAKAVVNFSAEALEINSVTAGDFFDDVSYNIYNSSGQVVINANLSLDSMLESKTGAGLLAALNVKAKAASGSATLSFDCVEGSSTDSNINDPTPTDIIDCTANVNGSYQLAAGSGAAASPSPSTSLSGSGTTGVGGDGSTPPVPVTGISWPTLVLFLGGLVLILAPILSNRLKRD